MHYNFYFDETFHDRKITVSENGTINALLEDADDSYIGVFIGFDNKYKSSFQRQFMKLESKYKRIYGINDEFKSTSIKRKNFIYGVKSFNENAFDFYNDFFNMLSDKNFILHVNILSKVELLVRNLYPSALLDKTIIPNKQFYYSLTKYIITYNNVELIKKLFEAIERKNIQIITEELIRQINITIETIKNIKRKSAEVPALYELNIVLDSIDKNSNIEKKIDFVYDQNFDGLTYLMKEKGVNLNKIDLIIDKEQKTYESAKKYNFNRVEEKDSKHQIFLRIVDHLCGFIGKMIYALCNDEQLKEDKVTSIEKLKDNDIKRKHLLSKEWFILNEEQFKLYKKITKALVFNQHYYWSTMTWTYCDEIVMFYSLLNYISHYNEYKDFLAVKSELHSEYYNGYVCSILKEQYKNIYK